MGSAGSKRVADSIATMTEYVLPTHTNALGGVFGGQILAWVDLCAAICAQRHTGHMAITAGIDELSFENPVSVEGEEATSGARWPCVTAFLTFVAVDEHSAPAAVPPLELVTEEE